MKGVRFTKAELAFLDDAMSSLVLGCGGTEAELPKKHPYFTVRAKLATAEAPVEPGVNVRAVETALVASSHGKAIALEGGHAMASRRCTQAGVTVEDAKLVGEWMARQGWLTGPMTLLDVVNKWHQWLPKARTTQPPPALPAGLGTDERPGQGPPGAGSAPGQRRTPQGFR